MKKHLCVLFSLLAIACSSDGWKKSLTGFRYRIVEQGSGKAVETGNYLKMHLAYGRQGQLDIFNSESMVDSFIIHLEKVSYPGSIEEAWLLLKEGDSAEFKFSAGDIYRRYFKTDIPKGLSENDELLFRMRLKTVYTRDQFVKEDRARLSARRQSEDAAIRQFLAGSGHQVKAGPDGIYFFFLQEGSGPAPVRGDSVELVYIGRYLDGEIFDKSRREAPLLRMQVGDERYLEAWNAALLSMPEGSMARLILPSTAAYGNQGSGPVKANKILVYDIELRSILRKQFP